MTPKDIRTILKHLELAEHILDTLDEEYAKNPENEALEAEWASAFKKERELHDKLEAAIVEITGGKIDRKVAHGLVGKHREALKDLLALGEEGAA